MFLLVGLGNPGKDYASTRHNVGYMVVDAICQSYGLPMPENKKFQSLCTTGMIGTFKVLLIKPTTFMNLSGKAVQAAMAYYKIPLDHVVVFQDELDIATGQVKVKVGGGSAGHNGIKDIDKHIGKNYTRVRVGIDHPGHKDDVSDYVLHTFSKAELPKIEKACDAIASSIEDLLGGDDSEFMAKCV
tara:strand:+ start:106 stop:663 length:558 start_codon:yes stop_codon:yes gene_type:complete